MGQAVAAVPHPPLPQASTANRSVGFQLVSTSSPTARTGSQNTKQRPKSNRPLTVVASLAGVCLLLLIVGVVMISFDPGDAAEVAAQTEPDAAAKNAGEETGGSDSQIGQSETNPSDQDAPAEQSGAEGEDSEVGAAASPLEFDDASSNSEAADVLRQIKAWNNLSGKRVQFGLKNIARFEVSIWLAADATGRPSSLKSPTKIDGFEVNTDAAKDSTAVATSNSTAVESGGFVFVELKITNMGNAPVQYRGWNATGDLSALLVDAAGNPLPLVPASETPNVTRLGATSIPEGGNVSDTIVFRAPADSTSMLRLALPKTALSQLAKGYFAIEAPPQSLRRKDDTPGASSLARTAAASGADDGARSEFAELQRQIMEAVSSDSPLQPGAAPTSSSVPAATVEPGDMAAGDTAPDKPPTAEEFDKFLRKSAEDGAGKDTESTPAAAAETAGK